jgi:hypothetical protein
MFARLMNPGNFRAIPRKKDYLAPLLRNTGKSYESSRAHSQPFKERLQVGLNFQSDYSYTWHCSSIVLLNVFNCVKSSSAYAHDEHQLVKMDAGHRDVIADVTYLIIRYYIKSLFPGLIIFRARGCRIIARITRKI